MRTKLDSGPTRGIAQSPVVRSTQTKEKTADIVPIRPVREEIVYRLVRQKQSSRELAKRFGGIAYVEGAVRVTITELRERVRGLETQRLQGAMRAA